MLGHIDCRGRESQRLRLRPCLVTSALGNALRFARKHLSFVRLSPSKCIAQPPRAALEYPT